MNIKMFRTFEELETEQDRIIFNNEGYSFMVGKVGHAYSLMYL